MSELFAFVWQQPLYILALVLLIALGATGLFYSYFTRPFLGRLVDDPESIFRIIDWHPDFAYKDPEMRSSARLEQIAISPMMTLFTVWHAFAALSACATEKQRMPTGVAMHVVLIFSSIALLVLVIAKWAAG
ncbi:MAG: hypothetical protein AAAFM81_04540 [Pseudomonadota bacterium]